MAKQRRNAGGTAANAGPEYQHRIGAFVCALMISRGELSFIIGSDQRLGIPISMRYESLNAIDDINVATDQGFKVYIQAKRSIEKAVLLSVLKQFVQQYKRQRPDKKTVYSLVTSSRSSYTVSHNARTVLEALRAAPSEDFSLSHNEALQNIYVFLVDASGAALKEVGLPYEDEDIRDLLQFVHIDVVDIEKNEQMEKAALLLLFRHASNEAEFLWSKLLKDNAGAASNRMTLEKGALEVRYQDQLRGDADASQWLLEVEIDVDELPVGVEYLLLEAPDDQAVVEYFAHEGLLAGDIICWGTSRFDLACHKTLKFSGDQCILPNGRALKLLARAGSAAALRRVMESQELFDFGKLQAAGNKILICGGEVMPSTLNRSGCARKYRPALYTAFHKNSNPSRCLVCGRPAIESGALTVEIDDEGNDLEIGLVHAECRKPTHRVIGTVTGTFLDLFPLLRRFDIDAYVRALSDGHGAFKSLPAQISGTDFVIAWSGEEYNPQGGLLLADRTREWEPHSCRPSRAC